jgi:3-deoxy-D-manno-octulosonic-acid transferase
MARKQVFLGDSMGELTMFYAAADVAFVGGSLVPVGGHNLLEPAALGIPVLTGTHNVSAPDIAERLAECGAAQSVANAQELARQLIHLLGDQTERQRRGELGRAAVENNRGTLERLLQLIDPLLAPSVTGDHTPQRDGLTRASR